MPSDPCTVGPGSGVGGSEDSGGSETGADRRRRTIVAGHRGDAVVATQRLADPEPAVRAAALGALARVGTLDAAALITGLTDRSAAVRRRAAELSAGWAGVGLASVLEALRRALDDEDPLVVETACWAVGEHADPLAVPVASEVAASHQDPRCREAAVAALGAIGDPRGLAAVLVALADRPAVRRRAAVALAAFDRPEADEGLRRCLVDRDWQVRQVAEILLDVPPGEGGRRAPPLNDRRGRTPSEDR